VSRKVSGASVRAQILRNLHFDPAVVVAKTARRFGVPVRLVEGHVNQLIAEGKLARTNNVLRLVGRTHSFRNPIAVRDNEHEVYIQSVEPLLSSVRDSVRRICYYGFTEIYNNAVDHSEGSTVTVHVTVYDYTLEFWISDDGVGIFEKLKNAFGLDDHRQVLAALAKGGVTTDPQRHSGQGIFFASRAFDSFWIISRGASFSHSSSGRGDWLLDNDPNYQGTFVIMMISKTSDLILKDLFDSYTEDKENYEVFKTHAPLRLSTLAQGDLVSRSQAKRILSRFEKYEEVFLDFEGVDFIGQAFADEIFRVFQAMNPSVKIMAINSNPSIDSMIEFVKNTVPSGPNDGTTKAV
jgi:STAS-like domain of unknown function (DUF4325)